MLKSKNNIEYEKHAVKSEIITIINNKYYKMNEYFEPRCCAGPRWSPSRSPTAPAPLHANSSSGTFPGSQDALYI